MRECSQLNTLAVGHLDEQLLYLCACNYIPTYTVVWQGNTLAYLLYIVVFIYRHLRVVYLVMYAVLSFCILMT